MKKTYFLLVLFVLSLQVHRLPAQSGIDKPIYHITTYRDSSLLGSFDIELFPLIAPLHVRNFDSLVSQQFYDSTAFHRVVPNFVIQGGDPNSINGPVSTWGQGQPWQPTVPAEFSAVRHLRGILGAARDTNINSANSQFYICVSPATFLDGNYTVYGKVTNGMTVVDTIVLSPRDANDVPLQKISMFITYTGVNDTVPNPVSLLSPADNAININTSQLFTWTAVNGAVLYTIEFALDSLFTNIVYIKSVGNNQTTAGTLPGSATYFWRVKSNNGGHESVYSQVWKFTTVTGAVTLVSPADSSSNVLLNPVFEWLPIANADNYQLQVATASTFSGFSLVFNQSGLTNTIQQIPALDPNTRYYWRVRSYQGSIAGYYSAKYTFETGTTLGISQPEISGLLTSVYPNPADEMLFAEIKPDQKAAVTILLRDISGKIVFADHIDRYSPVTYALDVSGLTGGFYFLEISNGTRFSSVKVVVK